MSSLQKSDPFAAVVFVLVALAMTAVVFAKTQPSLLDARLVGTWQSDAERTLSEIAANRPLTDEQQAKLRELFGKLRVTYMANGRWRSDLEGFVDAGRYQVRNRNASSLVLRSWSDELKEEKQWLGIDIETIYQIEFDGTNAYRLTNKDDALREYFRRVP